MRRTSELQTALADLDRILKAPHDDRAIDEYIQEVRDRQGARLSEVEGAWHNQRWGVAVLVGATLMGLVASVLAWHHLAAQTFDVVAKIIALAVGVIITVVLLIEDPFHEALGNKAYWLRLKGQGKVVAVAAVVALCVGLLDVFAVQTKEDTAARELERVQRLVAEIEPRLTQIKGDIDGASTQLGGIHSSLGELDGKMPHLQSDLTTALASLGKVDGAIAAMQRKLPKLATTDDLDTATDPLATQLGVAAATMHLAKARDVTNATQGLARTTDVQGLAKAADVTNATQGLAKTTDVQGLAKVADVTNATQGLAKAADVQGLAKATDVANATQGLAKATDFQGMAKTTDVTDATQGLAKATDVQGLAKAAELAEAFKQMNERLSKIQSVCPGP